MTKPNQPTEFNSNPNAGHTGNTGNTETKPLGKVYLVGAGPGAADLITVRGVKLLAQANIVLHDALVTPDMLALCPQAQLVSVGKRSGQRSASQTHINEQLVQAAHEHAIVVRLKGGDPMLFGRADEEMSALEQAGIPFEIVPGITTAMAAASSLQLPLTKRGVARSVALFTSSTAPNEDQETRIPDCDTLVQYMGGREAILTAQRMLGKGFPEDHPIVAIESCSRPDERHFHLTLAELAHGLPECSGPVLVIMGEAMRKRSSNS